MTAVGVVVALLGLAVGFAAGALVVLRSNGFFQRLSRVTNTLERTLGSPMERGTWGEVKLRQVVELAGMEQWCDFDSQVVLPGGVGRPDLVVRVPGDRRVIVDAKATLDAKGLRSRMRDLAAKRCW
jgi:DNA anti-recombination protein RmuC